MSDHPDIEREELEILLLDEGLGPDDARVATERIARSPRALIKTKVERELGLPYGEVETALGDAFVVGASYAVGAVIIIWPYLFWDVATALPTSPGHGAAKTTESP